MYVSLGIDYKDKVCYLMDSRAIVDKRLLVRGNLFLGNLWQLIVCFGYNHLNIYKQTLDISYIYSYIITKDIDKEHP